MLAADRPLSPEERQLRRQERRLGRARWRRARTGEEWYRRQLARVAAAVDDIVRGHLAAGAEPSPWELGEVESTLARYAGVLPAWARAVAARMLADVDRRDRAAWMRHSRALGRALSYELKNAFTGAAYAEGMARQVGLITSLPLEAARRVHAAATGAMAAGERGAALRDFVLETGGVTRSRAELIARTEVARSTTEITRARAGAVGATHYVWRSSEDSDVRPSHRRLNGTIHAWDDPPISDPPDHRAHPGQIWNCRCYPEPILPED